MPYEIQRPTKRLRAFALAATLTYAAYAALTAAPALADSPFDSTPCSNPVLTQPFTGFGDQGYYTLAPGESNDSFNATGWTLVRGARIQSATLADGSTGNVLDLPGGSMAVSPPMCVNTAYLTARAIVSDQSGPAGVIYYVSYPDRGRRQIGWLGGADAGMGWALSDPIALNVPGNGQWVMARFHFFWIGDDENGDFQLYNLYVDPYSRG